MKRPATLTSHVLSWGPVVGVCLIGWIFLGRFSQSRTSTVAVAPIRIPFIENPPLPVSRCAFRSNPRSFPIEPVEGLRISQKMLNILEKECEPTFRPPPVGLLIHELRVWGTNHAFADNPLLRCSSSREIFELLTDGRENKVSALGFGKDDFISTSSHGIHISLAGSDSSIEARAESHFGQLLAAFAVARVSSEHALITDSGQSGMIKDALNDMVATSNDGRELEFFTVALAHYLDRPFCWTDALGNQKSLEQLTLQLLGKPRGSGACYGTHVPYAIASILKCNEDSPCLEEAVKTDAEQYLIELSRQLVLNQEPDGTWLHWISDSRRPYMFGEERVDRINVTGHSLEWLAIAPARCRPDVHVINRAIEGLLKLAEVQAAQPEKSYKPKLPLTHALRALRLFSERR